MEAIFEITDTGDFVAALLEHLENKTQYGENPSVLSAEERAFYVVQLLDLEVNNGGFSQFFFNSAGNFSGELISAFQAIGAGTTAEICRKAISAFGCEIPADRAERIKLLCESENEEIDEILDACDKDFYDASENLYELCYQFVMKNKESFT